MKFNLNLASRRHVNKRVLNHAFVATLCLLLIFGAWQVNLLLTSTWELQQNRQQKDAVDQELRVLRGGPKEPLSATERSALEQKFEAVAQLQQQDAFRWTELLDRMEELLPAGVSLQGFRPNYTKKTLSLSGRARSLEKMRLFLDRLLKDKGFEQVYLKNHSRITVKDYAGKERAAIAFSIQLEGIF